MEAKPDIVINKATMIKKNEKKIKHNFHHNNSSFNYPVKIEQENKNGSIITTNQQKKTNYPDLLRAIDPLSLSNYSESSGFNYDHVSSKELSLIVKLHQKDYQPKWETIAETFENSKVQKFKHSKIQKFKTSKIQKVKIHGF